MFISQADIDHILRTGGNEDDARMKIVAEFSKQKPLEDRAAFLKALYHGGNGLITENGKISAWYGEDGIHIARGDTARYLPSAQVISWADAAERTEKLLDNGAFATNLEVTEAYRNERQRMEQSLARTAEQPHQPTVRELFDRYKLAVGNALSKDTAFVNACRNSDRQNAYLEGADAIRRIVTGI